MSKKFFEQRMMGLAMLIICIGIFAFCAICSEDCTAAILLTPLALTLMFSKKIWIV